MTVSVWQARFVKVRKGRSGYVVAGVEPERSDILIYQWKIPGVIPVNAQTAGEELERIYKRDGSVEPETVVLESKDEKAPLHKCFEWDDKKAAHKYRVHQAQGIIRALVSVNETPSKPKGVRAFVSVESEYQPIKVVMSDEKKRAFLLQSALCELKSFQTKYSDLQELASVFAAIKEVI